VAVDVGTGTGRVAELLVAAGWAVYGVEPDERMAAIARMKGHQVDVSGFEEWSPALEGVDLVCAGQAWHWIDPAVGFAKAAALLRPGGRVAIFWNAYRYEQPVRVAIEAACARHAPGLNRRCVQLGGDAGPSEPQRVEMVDSGHFETIETLRFAQTRSTSIEFWLEELSTHSTVSALAPGEHQRILEILGESLQDVTGDSLTTTLETTVVTGIAK